MPIIPLLPSSKALGAVPGAVLDKQGRPTVDNRGLSAAVGALGESSKQPAVPMSLADPYSAAGAVGQALQQGGNVLGALAIKRKEAETDIQVANADTAMSAKEAEFATWQRDNPDPAGWDTEWGKRVASFHEEIGADDKLNEGARAKIGLRATRWAGQSQANVATAAAKQTFAMAKSTFGAAADAAVEAQDPMKLDEALNTGLAKGYFYPHEAENWKQQFTKVGEQKKKEATAEKEKADLQGVLSPAIADPIQWKKDNPTPWAGKEILWQRARNAADSRQNEGTRDIASDLTNAIASGKIVAPAEIDAVKSPFLTEEAKAEAKGYLARRDGAAEKADREANGVRNAVELRHKVNAYDPAQDPTGAGLFALKAELSARVPSEMHGSIDKILDTKMGGAEKRYQLRPEVRENVTKTLGVMFDPETGSIPWRKKVPITEKQPRDEGRWFGADSYKKGDEVIDPATGKPKVVLDRNGNRREVWKEDPAAKLRAINAETKIEMGLDAWAKDNPAKANDPAEVQKQLQRLLPEGTRAGVLDTLQKKMAPKAPAAVGLRGFSDATDLREKLPPGLRPHAQDFIDAARETGLNPRVLAAISALETGGGTSKAFREKLNAMGISDASGPTAQSSVRDSIFHQARTLARADGPYAKARTIAEVGAIYAPPGAGNDPRGTNGGWPEGVGAWLAKL